MDPALEAYSLTVKMDVKQIITQINGVEGRG